MAAQKYIITLVILSLALTSNLAVAATARSQDGESQAASSGNYELYHRASLSSPIKGIYISHSTIEDRKYLEYLIQRSKQAGINTFVIDLNRVSSTYEKNILLVKNAGIKYVARIVVFPYGSDKQKMKSYSYLMSRYRLVEAAIALGADEIQLDYIRYAASNSPSPRNAEDVHEVISWFKEKIDNRAMLQIDVFGESSFRESNRIGQNVVTFSDSVDAICPMLYPSHFEPHREHVKRPYNIIYSALESLKSKFPDNKPPFKLYAYIELSNYRNKLSESQLYGYINSQIKAVEDAKADGWYAWSANNKYDRLFNIMTSR